VFEKCEKSRRREVVGDGFGEQVEERSGFRSRKGQTGGIVDGQVPAFQHGGDAPRQTAVGGDERATNFRRLDDAAHHKRNGRGFFPGAWGVDTLDADKGAFHVETHVRPAFGGFGCPRYLPE